MDSSTEPRPDSRSFSVEILRKTPMFHGKTHGFLSIFLQKINDPNRTMFLASARGSVGHNVTSQSVDVQPLCKSGAFGVPWCWLLLAALPSDYD